MGLLHLVPSAQGRIRSTRVRLGIMSWAFSTRRFLGAERSFMETHKICTGQSDALISPSVFICCLKIHKQLFQFRQCAPNVWLSHRKKDQLEKKKKNQDHKPGSNTASAFRSPGNAGGFFYYLCFQVKPPSAGRFLPGLRPHFFFPPPVKSTFTAGGIFKNKKKTGKLKPRLLCQSDNSKSVT